MNGQSSSKPKKARLGFVLLSHREPDAHFIRLLDWLVSIEGAKIAIHHDFGQSQFPDSLIQRYGLHMVHPWRPTQWGHASKVPATLNGFRALAKLQSPPEWYLTLSPNCYPIKPAAEIEQFYANASCDVFMQLYKVTPNADRPILRSKQRLLFTRRLFSLPWVSKSGKYYIRDFRLPVSRKRTPFARMDPYQGSDWFAMNHRAVQLMLNARLEESPVLKYLTRINQDKRTVVSPIEMVIQTFVGNHPDLNICRNHYRFIDWKNAKNYHPNPLTMEHWDSILNSEDHFARKFHPGKSEKLLDRIDSELLRITEI